MHASERPVLLLVLFVLICVASGVVLTSNGLTDVVQWDNYSLVLKGQRIFLHSGEFHTFRLPVPSLWLDILQKVKAMGLNAVSVYVHWGQVNPSPGIIDFDGTRSLQVLFDAAKVAGIWIVLRPGPYMNGEVTAGGIPHWVTSQVAGTLRTNATDYHDTWQDYIFGIINVTRTNQITEGGPVIAVQIDNEYSQGPTRSEYFQELEDTYRANGIAVPLTYNDPGQRKNFINGTGAVDIYGLDSYPQGFDCSNPTRWAPIPSNWHDYHINVNPSQPFYFPEFQGGSFDAWGPTAPGYPACRQLTGPDFQDVFYKAGLWASNAKLLSFYMLYGGTSWGAIPFPGVYTSYDYGSTIAENRLLTTKAAELRRQGLFLRSSPDFYKTDWIGNSSSSAVNVSNPNVFVVFLSNPDNDAGFYIARQNDSTSIATTDFSLQASTSNGTILLPQTIAAIRLSGRQSKVIVTDYTFGASHVLYSTASVLYAGRIGNRDVLFLYGDSDQQHEFAIDLKGSGRMTSNENVGAVTSASNTTIFTVLGNVTQLTTVFESSDQLVFFSDTDTAGTFFAPVIPEKGGSRDSQTFANYWQFGSNATVIVGGPYLVRNASISGSALHLRGDLNASIDTTLTIIAPPEISSLAWNGREVQLDHDASTALAERGGALVATLRPEVSNNSFTVPDLSGWRYANSLPEIQRNFLDEDWTLANHTTTNIPFKPYYGDGRVLYGCDYGFCENVVLWRGHFNAMGNETSVNLSINGGEAFAASVWLNDVFLSTSFGNSTNNRHVLEEVDKIFHFPENAVLGGQDNVITILQDNMGHNETGSGINAPKSPRGVRGFQLNTGNFSEWRVQGKIGGYTNFPDKTRGIMNEGGLFGERQGWHLPGFDTTGSEWESRELSDGLPGDTAGVGFFVTTFELHMPRNIDVPMSFVFDDGVGQNGSPYRALLFVNGWMMGKRVANLGPQAIFPVHEGILDYDGVNTVAVALWSMLPNAGVAPRLKLVADGHLEGGVGGIIPNNTKFQQIREGW